jgi:transcriptional regulator with PAS, ATPase and Fis domain
MGKNIEDVEGAVLDMLMRYTFPGNIRELENIMQHTFVLCRDSIIQESHLPGELTAAMGSKESPAASTLENIEKKAIEEALVNHAGNRTATAKQLAIDPSTLYRKMKRYGIK